MGRHTILVGLSVAVAVLIGCGKGAPTAAETAPFEAPITAYLRGRSMDMKVKEFRALEVDGDRATAVCSMTESSGLYGGGVAVRWTFTLTRDAQGGWRVEALDK